jgi:D-alanyl-D-alanine carboxypeptidase/D-alanyl-D-alanine-endopeptidase (penicillin-binding protein 4)
MSRTSGWRRAAVGALLVSVGTLAGPGQEVAGAGPADAAPDPVTTGDKASLGQRIDAILADETVLDGARIGVLAVDVTSGDVLYQRAADDRFNIASNVKMITTAAALHLLGPGHRFRTVLYADKVDRGTIPGDLYVRGGGDPSLGTYDLLALADDLVDRGIRSIRGGIVVDASLFDDQNLPPKFDAQPKEQASFRAPIAALSLNFNAVAIVVRPNPAGVGPATVVIDPPNDYVTLTGQVQTVASGRNRVRIETVEEDGRFELRIGGQLPASRGTRRYRRRVADPIAYAASALRHALEARGIRVRKKQITAAQVPDDAIPLATRASPPLAELVRGMGKYSNNFVAEMLLKAVGTVDLPEPRPATWRDGLAAVRNFLGQTVGIDATSLRYENGSGLFDASDASPRQMVTILSHAARDFRYGPDLVSSLSIGGVDGTLRKRMRESPAAGLVRAKTGTLATVAALSGFVAVDARVPIAFAVFVNDQPDSYKAKRAARRTIDRIAGALARFLGAP